MNKVYVIAQRSLQNGFPFQGKIVFTLQGDNSELITSFIPETAFFYKGRAVASLVPNSEIEGTTYYKYSIYPHGHRQEIFLSEPVEEGYCIVPNDNCSLDDIISNIPSKDTAEEIIANATAILAEIRTSLNQARECAESACKASSAVSNNKIAISSLVQQGENYYIQTKNKQEEVAEATAFLNQYQENIERQIRNIFAENTLELQQNIQEEQCIINALWDKINKMFSDVGTVEGLQDQIRNLHDTYIADMNNLKSYVQSLHIPTKLSELENDILEPIPNQEINTLYGD